MRNGRLTLVVSARQCSIAIKRSVSSSTRMPNCCVRGMSPGELCCCLTATTEVERALEEAQRVRIAQEALTRELWATLRNRLRSAVSFLEPMMIGAWCD